MAGTKRIVHVFSKISGLPGALVERITAAEVKVVYLPPSAQRRPITATVEPARSNGQPLNEESRCELQSAEILLADPTLIASHGLVQNLPKLKWLMSTWAGTDSLIRALDRTKPLPGYQLTKFSGYFGPMMSEYVIGYVIERERKFQEMKQYQERKDWAVDKMKSFRTLSELTLGILGVGDIGKGIAKIAKAFGMSVWGYVQTIPPQGSRCEYVDQYRHKDGLPELLASCDYICNILPSTPNTVGLLSADTLAHCKGKRTVFINVGRGDIVDESSLLRALQNQWISHAVCDVFPMEPLPADSPLWSHPRVTVTPHVSAVSNDIPVAECFRKNFIRYVAGQELEFPVSWDKGY